MELNLLVFQMTLVHQKWCCRATLLLELYHPSSLAWDTKMILLSRRKAGNCQPLLLPAPVMPFQGPFPMALYKHPSHTSSREKSQ